MIPTKYRIKSIGFSVLEKKRKIDFKDGGHGGHLGFPIGTLLTIIDVQVTPMLPTKFQVNWPFGSGVEAKNKKKKKKKKSWISDRSYFSYFLIYKSPWCFLASFKSTGLSVQENKRFSRWGPSWISDRNDLAIFDLQVTLMLPTKFQVNRPFGSGGEAKNRFRLAFRSKRFWLFLIYKSPQCFLSSFESVGPGV